MDTIDYVKELGIRSPFMFIRDERHPDQDVESDYCVYEPHQNKFHIFMHGDDLMWELHGLGQVKSHELGFPLLSRIVRKPESQEESQIYDGSNKALQNFFQHPHTYSIIERFMSSDDWDQNFDRVLGKFENGTEYYGSADFSTKRYMAAFAVANMALQVAEILLSAKRYSKGQVARAERCMKAIDRLEDNGIPLRDNFWDRATSTLGTYYDRSVDKYTDNMEDEFCRMSNLMLPDFITMNIYTGPTKLTDGIISPVPGLDIPNWLIDYQVK